MPLPSRLKPNARPAAVSDPSGVWGRATPVESDPGFLRISTYGRGKTGKTRLISTLPKPIIIIGAEDGTKSIKGLEGVDFMRVILRGNPVPAKGNYVHLDELPAAVSVLGDTRYKSAAVDTASALQDIILASILGLQELPEQKSWGMATREQYGQCTLQLKTILRRLLDQPLHAMVTAHERNFNDDTTSDLITPTIGSALSPAAAGWLNGAVDYICQTFIREAEEEQSMIIGAGKSAKEVKTRVKTGGMEYCLRIGPHPVYMTGFRLPPGFTLPDVIVNPTYDKIMEVIRGKK